MNQVKISRSKGSIKINDEILEPFMLKEQFLNTNIYRHFSLDKEPTNRILLKINIHHQDWIFALDFKKNYLKTILIYKFYHTLTALEENSLTDFDCFHQLITRSLGKGFFKKDSTPFWKKPWGILRIGKYPDGILMKILIRYSYRRWRCLE